MHNVEGCFPWLCQGKLGLSNTCFSEKTLSFPKPPRNKSSFAAPQALLDRKAAPGRGRRGTLQGSVLYCSARFRTVPSIEAYSRPWRPGSYPTRRKPACWLPSFPPQPFGRHGPSRPDPAPVTPLGPRGPRGSDAGIVGYYSDYPFERKVAAKAIYTGVPGGSGGSSRTLRTAPSTFRHFRSGPLLLSP